MNEKELLDKVEKIIQNEVGDTKKDRSDLEILREDILPALKSTKDVLAALYAQGSRKRSGVIGKLKTMIQQKLTNITINVMEKPMIRQQKFNDLVYKAIEKMAGERV